MTYSGWIIASLAFLATVQTALLFRAEGMAEKYRDRAVAAEASVEALQAERESLVTALETNRVQIELVRTERNNANAKLKEIRRANPPAATWFAAPIPPAMLSVFK